MLDVGREGQDVKILRYLVTVAREDALCEKDVVQIEAAGQIVCCVI